MLGDTSVGVDINQTAGGNLVIQADNLLISKQDATSGSNTSEMVFVVGAVDIDVASERVHPIAAVLAPFESFKPKDAGGDQVALLDLLIELPEKFSGGDS